MGTKSFLNVFVLVFLSTGLLIACKSSNNSIIIPSAAPEAALLATGGTGSAGSGGSGGSVYIESYGSVTVSKAGTVDASFDALVSAPVLSFGTNSFVVSAGTTTVLLVSDPTSMVSGLYVKPSDHNLYIGDGDGDTTNDLPVTGLLVDVGATLVLVDQGYWGGYGTVWLSNDLLINGTITSDAPSVYIEANLIDVESGGKITTSATTPDTNAGEIYLGNGNSITRAIINRGTVEAKGLGNGSGGYMYFEPNDLVVNYGTIDASGGDSTVDGSSGGSGGISGELDVYVDYGDFYSSGIVRVNGGKGLTYGGDNEADYCNYNCNSIYIETAYHGNAKNGDIIISGTWEANGGNGTSGNGSYGGYIYLQTDALGTVTINANMSTKGGDGNGTGYYGGNTYGIDIYSEFDPDGYGGYDDTITPGKIILSGHYDLRGGAGDQGGTGGYLEIYGANATNGSGFGPGVELVNFPAMNLNGGDGTTGGGSASSWAFELYTYAAGGAPAGPITNEAAVQAKGGNATGAGVGGTGGYVEMVTGTPADASTVVNNSGGIDVSGGTGDNGGNGGNINMSSATPPTVYTGPMSDAGGSGTTPGSQGTITIDGSLI